MTSEIAATIKAVSDAGLGLGALIALIFVIYFQWKYIQEVQKSMQQQNDRHATVIEKLSENIRENTEVTRKTGALIENNTAYVSSQPHKRFA